VGARGHGPLDPLNPTLGKLPEDTSTACSRKQVTLKDNVFFRHVAKLRRLGGGQNFRGGTIVTGKHTQQLTTVLRVRYKTMLRAERADFFWFVLITCDILGYSRK